MLSTITGYIKTDLRSACMTYHLSAEYIAYYIYGCIDGARVIPKKLRTLLRRVFIFGSYSKGYNGFGSAVLD